MSKYRWVKAAGDGSEKFYDFGILADGTLHNPRGERLLPSAAAALILPSPMTQMTDDSALGGEKNSYIWSLWKRGRTIEKEGDGVASYAR